MCGIAGIVTQAAARAYLPGLEKMVRALSHRGPDSNGVVRLGSCLLGNTRLAIVDLSERGKQPMSNEDQSVWITYNGECYNAAELRDALIGRAHQFRSSTDTEVVLHLYEEFGEGCVEKLRGMFAFAIWDTRTDRLLLARDRMGIKPLYFATAPGTLLFASETKALLASELIPRKLDASGIRAFLQLGHVPPPWTAVCDVRPLEPGHIGVWQNGEFTRRPYWTLQVPANGKPRANRSKTAGTLQDILVEASRLQLMADVPIALFLSAGVDSAAIGALMRRAGARQLTALTVGFEEEQYDESEASRRTAELLDIPHRVLRLPAREMAASLDHAIWAMDQPTVDGLNTYWICRAAVQAGFKVALSGQGGDELFGGYESLGWFEGFSNVASWLRTFPRKVGGLLDHESLPFRWRKLSYLVGADDPFVASQLSVKVLYLERDLRQLLSPALATPDSGSEAANHLASWARQVEGRDLREKVAFMDIHTHLEPRLLRDGDAMSMAHSLEVRPVFLDHALVEYVLSLPAGVRLDKKRLLLEATRGLMPEGLFSELLGRPKRTFTFPFARWLGGELRAQIEETFEPARMEATGVLNARTTQALWRRYLRSPAAVGWSRIWSLYVLQRWCETMHLHP
jgi:asparagine synthase (glutamine-hydrolysing)